MDAWWRELGDLDEGQRGVIGLPPDGSFLVKGPPGSGKTNLLLLRANYLAATEHSNLAVVVFNRTLREFICAGGGNYHFDPANVLTSRMFFGRLLGEAHVEFEADDRLSERTAEERVQFFDETMPFLMDSRRPPTEKAFAIALTAHICRPGFSQQASLLRDVTRVLPEAMLWLGAMQADAPLTETLAFGEGMAWRLARELFGLMDIFAPPLCDISFAELEVLCRRRDAFRVLRPSVRSRIDVELYAGLSVFVRYPSGQKRPDLASDKEPMLPIDEQIENEKLASHARKRDADRANSPLSEIERSLEALVGFVRKAREVDSGAKVPGRTKKRR
jgi:hypothetical protein